MPVRSIEKRGNRTHITIVESLEFDDIELIRDGLRRGGRLDDFIVDFRGTRECEASTLLVLVTLFSSIGVSVEFTGLSRSNRRVLEYLRPSSDSV